MKAIIFDLDNTLIDTYKQKKVCCEKAIEAMHLNLPKKKAFDILFELFLERGLDDPIIFQKFLKKVEGKIDYKKLAYGITAYRKIRFSFLKPYPGTIETLKALKRKHLKLAIISDAPKLKAWLRLAAMKIDPYFDLIITADDVKVNKTSPKAFNLVMKSLKVKPSECLAVGDRLLRDIDTPSRLGIKTCFAEYGTMRKTKSKADYKINNIKGLLKIKL